jgi:hypothetical protein
MTGEHGGQGPQKLAESAVRYLACALVTCVVIRVVAAAVTPLLPVLETAFVFALICALVLSRLHL